MTFLRSLYFWIVGGLAFGVILIVVIAASYFAPPRTYDPWIKRMFRGVFALLHTKVEVEGVEEIEPDRAYLFMANHVSIFDIPLLQGYIPVFFRGVQADRQFKWPLYGWAARRHGNIPIERGSHHSSARSIRRAADCLRNGDSIVILPEGHRTLDGKLRPFKRLPFFLAKEAGVDVVPIGMSGLFHLKRKGSWHINPTTVKIKFGSVIAAEKVNRLSEAELRDLTRGEIKQLIDRP